MAATRAPRARKPPARAWRSRLGLGVVIEADTEARFGEPKRSTSGQRVSSEARLSGQGTKIGKTNQYQGKKYDEDRHGAPYSVRETSYATTWYSLCTKPLG